MSLIVILKDKDKFIVGCDTRVCGNGKYIDDYYGNKKAKHLDINNEIIIAACGNILLLDFLEITINKVKRIDRNTIINEIIPTLMNATKSTPCSTQEGYMDGELLIAYKDKAFSIASNYSVFEIKDFYAFGSGGDAALGSLYTSKNFTMTPQERVALAIMSASNCVYTVSNQVFIGDTRGSIFKQYNKIPLLS